MRIFRKTLAAVVLSTPCLCFPAASQIVLPQIEQQKVDAIWEALPVLALSYLQSAARAYNSAKANLSQIGEGLTFTFATVPFILKQVNGELSQEADVSDTSACATDSVELGSLQADASELGSSFAEDFRMSISHVNAQESFSHLELTQQDFVTDNMSSSTAH
ncbi:hypothetical protein H4R24_002489 [Coemansia sp. RSA 988]|nr:hypothetical protein H4R24_002489 [Coemansia sp. RSA 988]